MTMTTGIRRFLAEAQPATPCLVIDLDTVVHNYRTLAAHLPLAGIYYAVKANPAPAILEELRALGSSFDTASRGEIDLCLDLGVSPTKISFGNTIKKERDVAYAYDRGIRLFAFDSEAELEKLSRSAPGSQVFCRILVDTAGAEWPLSRKFGCVPQMAEHLLQRAKFLGLDPVGVSFHVGSQQTDCSQWEPAIASVAAIFASLAAKGTLLTMINLGGGMPAKYRDGIQPVKAYADAIMEALTRHFGANLPTIIIEPGRSLVGEAGVIQSEVVLVSRKSEEDEKRWVYLDVGKFNGMAETMDESIKYRIVTEGGDGETGPVIIAGPTCDSADILYEVTEYRLPLDLAPGDMVQILSTGAYTATYASVAFNGFAPLQTYCIGGEQALRLRDPSRLAA